MFDKIFGNYLVKTKKITSEQLEDALAKSANVRARLGTIAVSEQMLSKEQADELNRLQSTTDKRFGVLAVEKGYLTDEQVDRLLKKQGNAFLVFIQILIDASIMSLEEIDECVEEYRVSEGFSHNEIDDLVSGDIDRVVSVFLPNNNVMTERFCALAMRTLVRIVDNKAYINKGYIAKEIKAEKGAMQVISGDHTIHTIFIGEGSSLLGIAEGFAKEQFETVDLDALDAVAEFANCVDGLFATELSQSLVDVDMEPPVFFPDGIDIKGESLCVLPIVVKDKVATLVVSIDADITTSQG